MTFYNIIWPPSPCKDPRHVPWILRKLGKTFLRCPYEDGEAHVHTVVDSSGIKIEMIMSIAGTSWSEWNVDILFVNMLI